jgi:preprotein translocase subunit SecG
MHLAAIDWLSISINLLLVAFVIVCLLMSLLILMQRPKQEGLGAAFGGGVTDQVFGARTTNVLQRGTVYLASLFFILSLALAILIGHQNKKTSLVSPKAAEEKKEEVKPAEPTENQPKSLLDELPAEATKTEATAPATPVETPASPAETPATPVETATVPVETPAQPVDPSPDPAETTPPVEAPAPVETEAPTETAPEDKSGQP